MHQSTGNEPIRRNLLVPPTVGQRHWRVYQVARDMDQPMSFGDLRTLTNLPNNKLAASLEYLCRHTFLDRRAVSNGKAQYQVTGRRADSIDQLLAYEAPRPMTAIRGRRANSVRSRLKHTGKHTTSAVRPTTVRMKPALSPHINGDVVGATAFVRVTLHGKPAELTYAEANRLYEQLGKVFVRG